ncbi:hypothetical protein BS50DRAFT_580379 [Corynespora cassiicola Philippines]|uniref:Uncharacterized protein n=1 Tax=Corynespora cassiicola Philippines TaxID=1448308 RepID=A0A2T2N0D6_CORCC|nr:hypothetical protein BS50DRAFT_580377 [Corynespora cassiicola Philippines]PSN58899.1 hypothetical protein BS50DRAFT_580379 [Corynespora cassiicola Philippines]
MVLASHLRIASPPSFHFSVFPSSHLLSSSPATSRSSTRAPSSVKVQLWWVVRKGPARRG